MAESIGSFTFNSIEGPPRGIGPVVETESRHGKDDVYLWKVADSRGEEFSVTTHADFDSLAAAQTAVQSYIAAIGTTVAMQFGGIQQTQKVSILNVRPMEVRKIVGGAGGVAPTAARAKAVCHWSLIARTATA